MNTNNTNKENKAITTYSIRKQTSCWGDTGYFVYKNGKQHSEDYTSVLEAFQGEELDNLYVDGLCVALQCFYVVSTPATITKVLFDDKAFVIDFISNDKEHSLTYQDGVYEVDENGTAFTTIVEAMKYVDELNTIKTINKSELATTLTNLYHCYYIEETKDMLGDVNHVLRYYNSPIVETLGTYSLVGVSGADAIYNRMLELHPEIQGVQTLYVRY